MSATESEHALKIQLATAIRECNALHVRLRGETELADRAAKDVAETLDSLNAAQAERDSLRSALTEVNDLLTSVPEGEDWRQVVRRKVVVALFGEAAWSET